MNLLSLDAFLLKKIHYCPQQISKLLICMMIFPWHAFFYRLDTTN